MQGNSSHWIQEGQRQGINVDFLYQDKSRIYEALHELGLPTPQFHRLVPPVNRREVKSIFGQGSFFSRLVPKDRKTLRPYHLRLESAQEFWDFVSEHDLRAYQEVHLIERGDLTHSGAIIASTRTIAELVRGDGPSLFHGTGTPISAEVSSTGTITYPLHHPTEDERELLFRALKIVGGPKNPFPGYYEFEVWDRRQIKFRNYQKPDTAYGRL